MKTPLNKPDNVRKYHWSLINSSLATTALFLSAVLVSVQASNCGIEAKANIKAGQCTSCREGGQKCNYSNGANDAGTPCTTVNAVEFNCPGTLGYTSTYDESASQANNLANAACAASVTVSCQANSNNQLVWKSTGSSSSSCGSHAACTDHPSPPCPTSNPAHPE